ncbi:unnamed protein product [Miscanthus lutarioriparius]|uniref:Uncharacterized protein n=1 Tax=Miscanthus lutarioriparius TaxID=422564 RepID=A0A811PK92_9POAL|nr:unnamed protein product [Miscanthus lutarioriparius]
MDSSRIALLLVLSSKLLLAATALHDDDDDTLTLPRLPGGQHEAVWNTSNMGEGVVIGVLDDGIDAGHPSFGDEGMPPPPARWRGRCKHAGVALCNNKLVGARDFTRHLRRPGTAPRAGTHGMHASSVAAGAFVRRPGGGGAPGAPVVAACAGAARGCSRGSVVHAVEAALADGVDVLSLSLGDDDGLGFHEDPVAAATFSAVVMGVFVCAAAGNKGRTPGSVANDTPWILTVGASSQSQATAGRHSSFRHHPGVLLAGAEPQQRRRAEAGHRGSRRRHPCGGATVGARPELRVALRHVHGGAASQRGRGADKTRPPNLVPRGHQVRDNDHGRRVAHGRDRHAGELLRHGRRPRRRGQSHRPGPSMENTEAKDLNAPSIMVALTVDGPAVTVIRKVTNVGAARSVYRVDVSAPDGVSITVVPGELQFDEVNQEASFVVTMERAPGSALESQILGAQLAWVSEDHVVRSPISISA